MSTIPHSTCRLKGCQHYMQLILPVQVCIKYGPRHYMHGDCYVKSGKPFADLTKHQAEQLPYFAVKDAGRLRELEAYIGDQHVLPGERLNTI
jgi:hypothetical protein